MDTEEIAALDLLSRMRFACGDNGKRMQDELEAYLRELREDADRLDWLDANGFTAYRAIDPIEGLSNHCVVVHETMKPRRGNVAGTIREAIDAARNRPKA